MASHLMTYRSPLFCLFLALAILTVLLPTSLSADTTPFYYNATIESSVNPVTASYLERSVERAESDGAQALILTLDTPGGLMQSMNEMTDVILNANVPVVIWIGPSGARAASAGVFLTYASHYAAMADGTRLGAAHPVSGSGQSMDETMKEKVTNDAVAQLRGYARQRGRNEDLADSFVRESVSLIADEALERNVVEANLNSVPEVLEAIEGRTFELSSGDTVTLEPGEVRDLPMNSKEGFLNVLANPNLVYILLMLGIYGFVYEFSEPGVGLGLIVGGICLLLSLYGMSLLPLNYTGLGLLFLGIALMFLDLFVPTFGVLTLGGITSFALGSVFLFRTEAFAVSLGLIVGVTAATVTFVLICGYLILGAMRSPVAIGGDSIEGRTGTVKELLDPGGMVYVRGEYWDARSADDSTIEKDQKVEVTEKRDRTLLVKRYEEDESE